MKAVELAIIGGGAAGMFAAVVAAERGLKCVLIERKARLGSKVLMTANGRCNFTKDISPEQFLKDVGVDFLRPAIMACPPRRIIKGFQSFNVPLRRMADGRMFPADGKAATIVHAFGDSLRDEEVPIITNCPVKAVKRRDGGFVIETDAFELGAKNVLIATGGVSYPKTGSVGDGQRFAAQLGLKVTPYRPGLIGLETRDERVVRLAGRRFEDDGRVQIYDRRHHTIFDYRGEVDCENFGLSGAAIYNAQRFLEHYTGSRDELMLEAWFGRNRIAFPVNALKPRPVKEAIVTIGGVALNELDPRSMMSKKVPGLYFAGEVIDVDGPTGGYNLTIAFATAHLAVSSILKR